MITSQATTHEHQATEMPHSAPAPVCPGVRRSLRASRRIISPDLYDEIVRLGRAQAGLRVAHVNATPEGGGVAEILHGLVPLLWEVGVQEEWYVMEPDEAFFGVTKRLHNMLQGAPGELSASERRIYCEHNERTSERLRRLWPDIWVIHDPQPAAAGAWMDGAPTAWRCHIDTSQPNPAAAAFLSPYLAPYGALVFSEEAYQLPIVSRDRAHIIEPAIDPLARKNRRMRRYRARQILARIGIDPDRPLVSQVARLDPWKDPLA